jgi:hypothetical protein
LKELEKRKLGWLKASVWEEGTAYVGTQKKEAVERTGMGKLANALPNYVVPRKKTGTLKQKQGERQNEGRTDVVAPAVQMFAITVPANVALDSARSHDQLPFST